MKPYYQDEWVTIYHGDCGEILPTLDKVDLVLTDPPYGVTRCEWDKDIDLVLFWELTKQLTGTWIITASQPFTSYMVTSNPADFSYELIWIKTKASGHLDANRKPLKNHESILFFSTHGYPKYYPQGLVKGEYKTGRNVNMDGKVYGQYSNHGVSSWGNYPKSAFVISNPSNEGHQHPTQKPIALMEYLTKTYTEEGKTILDPFLGSGTTAYCAKKLNRHCIGIEIEEKYCEIAAKRCSQSVMTLNV
jgi:site-specific DNA-methyltransferase (adenine-specific)